MKKRNLIALVLALVMCLSSVVPAFAAIKEPDAEINVCIGGCNRVVVGTRTDPNIVKIDNTYHGKAKYNLMECSVCLATSESFDEYVSMVLHSGPVQTASCDGQTQYYSRKCSTCDGIYYTQGTCPGAGHGPGYCKWLPL